MNDIQTMFQIDYFQFDVGGWEEKKKKLLDLMNERKLDFFGGDNHTSYASNIEDTDLSNQVKIILADELTKIQNILGFEDYSINYSWFQEELKGMFHHLHNHGSENKLSCVCYIEYDEKYHNPITFVCPYPGVFDGVTQYTQPTNVKSGTIIFFPSVINHFTIPNKTNIPRKILSFNIKA